MTSKVGSAVTSKVIDRLNAPTTGLNAGAGALTLPGGPAAASIAATQIRGQNVAADLAERSSTVRYPAINVYCEKIVNSLDEKFRRFSGRLQMAIELRHSQNSLSGLQDAVEVYVDAITQTLDGARGDWGDGMFYAGGYEVTLGAVKQGGSNFIQAAKITFQIGVSRS